MSCTIGKAYVVKAGDAPFDIAQRELGDGNRWREILKHNGLPLTENDAVSLQLEQILCIPDSGSVPPLPPSSSGFANIVSRQTYEAMFPHRNPLYS